MTSFFNPFSLPILFLSILISFLSLTAHAADPYLLSYVCENTTFSASDSIYQSNLNSLLSSFSSNANVDFFATTRGSDTSVPVYGLFNCRGDLTSQDCRDCVNAAVKEITNNCSTQIVAIIWYDMCVLRYSNRSFFSTVDETPMFGLLNTLDVTDPNKFNQLLNASLIELLVELAKETSNIPTGANKFGTKQVTMTNFQTLYSLVQCTPDLSGTDCNNCLQDAIKLLPSCCSGKQGGRIVFPSCNLRYELYRFYETVATVPPPSPGKDEISPAIIIAIVVTFAASVLQVILAYCLLRRRAKEKSNAINEASPKQSDGLLNYHAASEITTVESQKFDFGTIEATTNKFSDDKKIGEGGFGKVYKAWRLWCEGKVLEFVDNSLMESCWTSEIVRCIHIGLLCVQENPQDKPTISTVVVLLGSESIVLPQPKHPAFSLDRFVQINEFSVNELSFSSIVPQ